MNIFIDQGTTEQAHPRKRERKKEQHLPVMMYLDHIYKNNTSC